MRKELSVPSGTEYLGEVRKAVTNCVEGSSFEADANKLVLAVDEAVTNVIEHAYAHDLEGESTIEIVIEADSEKFCAEIRDRGNSFDPTGVELPDIREHVKKGKRSGLGVFLIRRIMDEVRYSNAGGVNTLRMVKYAGSAGPKGAGDA